MIRILLPVSVFAQEAGSTYCEPCDPETSLRGTDWKSSDTTKNYETIEAARTQGANSDNKYKVYVKMPCPPGWNSLSGGFALRYCDGFGNWQGTLYENCPSDTCSADAIAFSPERKVDVIATKAACSGGECAVKCTAGTPNVAKISCFGGKWIPDKASCAAGAPKITIETEAPYVEYDPDDVSGADEGKSAHAKEENSGSSGAPLIIGAGALIAVLAGVGYMYQKKGAAPEKSGSFMTDERKGKSGRRKKGAQE